MIAERFEELEEASLRDSRKENPPVLRVTKVAQTIASLPEAMSEYSYEKEYEALRMNVNEEEKAPNFETNRGLWYLGKQVTNFHFEFTQVSLLVEERIGQVKGYVINLKVHVFKHNKEEIHEFSNVSKDTLCTLEFLNQIPFAVPLESVNRNDIKQILYWYVNHLLMEYRGKITYITKSNGWFTYKDRQVYVDGEKAIGLPDLEIKSLGGNVIQDVFQGNLWNEFLNMRFVLSDQGIMEVILLYVLMSYSYTLLTACKKTLKHSCFLVGSRGTRKTALGLCFTQLHNKETPKFNFLATEAGVQAHLQEYRDACMLFDDLAPSINMAKRTAAESKLEMVLRLVGDSTERVISPLAKPTMRDLKYKASGGVVLTGEYFYSAGVESSIARAVVLEIEKDSVDLKRLSYYQEKPQILESLIARYLNFVSQNWESLKIIFVQIASATRTKYLSVFSNDRYADYIGQYVAQAYILGEFFKISEGIETYEIEKFVCEVERDVCRLLEKNDRNMKKRAPIYTILASILNLEEEGKCIPWNSTVPTEGLHLIETEDAFYVKQKDLADIVRNYCLKTGEPYVKLTAQELGKILAQEEICTIYYEGEEKQKRLAKKYSQYKNQRYMELSKSKIKDKLR